MLALQLKKETTEEKREFLCMLLFTLGACLLGNMLAGERVI